MMKRIILFMLAITMIIPAVTVSAAEREVGVWLYRDYSDCVFFVSWENTGQTASVQIRTPDGDVIDADSNNAVFSRGGVAVDVGYAASGHWTVIVTGDNLGGVSISGGNRSAAAAQHNAIQSFNAELSGAYINFSWNVVSSLDAINVMINAHQGGNQLPRTIHNDFSAPKTGMASISADDMQTGLYSFTIQAFDGNTQYTLTTDEPLYIRQSNAPAKLENVRVGSIDGEMFAVWNTHQSNSYLVTIYEYNTLAVMRTERVNSNFYPIDLGDDLDRVKFSVAVVDGNVHGEFDVFEIVRSSPAGTITFPDFAATRESVVRIFVDCPHDVTAGVYLNGTLLLEDATAGDYDLTLSEGIHEIVAYLKDANGNMRTFSNSITVDKTPPALNLNISDETQTASENIVIGGNTEPNAVVAINGIEQELGSGDFMARLALANGVNPVTVSAYDLAGNKSVRTVTVERTGAVGDWTVFILPGIAFLLLGAWYIYLNKKTKGAQAE